eukprot:1046463-Ditylum_brightwellii.AAC.1
MIEEAFVATRKLQWNIKSEKDGIVEYNYTPETIIMMLRIKWDNSGWDYHHLTNTGLKGEVNKTEGAGNEQEDPSSE